MGPQWPGSGQESGGGWRSEHKMDNMDSGELELPCGGRMSRLSLEEPRRAGSQVASGRGR